MQYTATEVNLNAIQQEAEGLFGPFYCSEAVLHVIHKHFGLQIPRDIIAMASAMPVGIGGSGCVCGALNGGLLALGCFFGRSEPGDAAVGLCMELGAALHNWFRTATGKNSTCCRVLIREFDAAKAEHAGQCTRFTGMVARETARMIAEKLGIAVVA